MAEKRGEERGRVSTWRWRTRRHVRTRGVATLPAPRRRLRRLRGLGRREYAPLAALAADLAALARLREVGEEVVASGAEERGGAGRRGWSSVSERASARQLGESAPSAKGPPPAAGGFEEALGRCRRAAPAGTNSATPRRGARLWAAQRGGGGAGVPGAARLSRGKRDGDGLTKVTARPTPKRAAPAQDDARAADNIITHHFVCWDVVELWCARSQDRP